MDQPDAPEDALPRPLPPASLTERVREYSDHWRGRVAWVPVVSLVVLSFAVAWWVTRPEPVAPPRPDEVLPLATPAPESVVVHVAGAVEAPDVISVLEGARVVDVVGLAGGLQSDADLSQVNLAALVRDGERLWIPRVGEPEPLVVVGRPPSDSGASETGVAGTSVVDLNLAAPAELETLPGIGPATAAAIVGHRERNGAFGSVDDLVEVAGVGPAKLDAIRSLVVV